MIKKKIKKPTAVKSIIYLCVGILLLTLSPFVPRWIIDNLSENCSLDYFGNCINSLGYGIYALYTTIAIVTVGIGLILRVLIPFLINLYRVYTGNKKSLVIRKINIVGWTIVWLGTLAWSRIDPYFQSHIYHSFVLSNIFGFIPLLITSFVVAWAYSISVIKNDQRTVLKATIVGGVVVSILSYLSYILILVIYSFLKV